MLFTADPPYREEISAQQLCKTYSWNFQQARNMGLKWLSWVWADPRYPRGFHPLGMSLFMPTEQLSSAQNSPPRSMQQMLWYYWEPQREICKPREGHHELLACPWTENFDHLTGKNLSMATKAGRDLNHYVALLPGTGRLDPSICNHAGLSSDFNSHSSLYDKPKRLL